jgi:DNA-binding winged helix-turn-helix (wHTH) protein/TolB-like protein/Tfp pilus assembly protein PilF
VSKRRYYNFDSFRVDPTERVLLRDGKPISLSPKVFDTLLALVERSGHIVSKDQLVEIVWPDVFVEENNLTQYVAAARRALGDNRQEQRYIETVPKRGYRFAPSVQVVTEETDSVLIEEEESLRIVVKDKIEEQEVTANGHSALRPNRWLAPAVLAGAVLLSVTAIVTVRFRALTEAKPPAAVPIKSIAVLPFKSLGVSGGDEYLGLGMADALITRLGHIREISVRPTSAIQKYATEDRDPGAIGRELNVDAVLDCRIQRSGDRIRVTAQLVSAQDGAALWTASFDEKATESFALEDSISSQVAQAITSNLSGDEKNLLTKLGTRNNEAYQSYLKGRYYWSKRTREGMLKAVEYFQQAIRLDPNYAQGYAGLADSYLVGGAIPGTPADSAKIAALKALELDDTLAEAHTSLAYYEGAVDWNWPGAEAEFERALALNPSYSTAHHWHAYNLAAMGRLDKAIAEITRAQELDPLSLIVNTDAGHMLYLSRRYDEAIGQYRRVLEMDPHFRVAHWRLGECYAQKRMYTEAIAELQQAISLDLNDRSPEAWLGYTRAAAGQRDQALEVLAQLKMTSKAPLGVAMVYAGLEDKDQAFNWLQKAFLQREADLVLVQVDPIFDSLHADPRYLDLLRRMKLVA